KVNYGRKSAKDKNISRVHLVVPKPGTLSGPETENFPGPLSGPTSPGTLSGPTSEISGGGGASGGKFLNEAKPPAHAPIGHNAGPPLEPDKSRQPAPALGATAAANGHANLTSDAVARLLSEHKLRLRIIGRKNIQ